MITLFICLLLTMGIAMISRVLGASRRISVALALLPMIVLLAGLGANDGLGLGPHGGIFPSWFTIVVGLLTALFVSLIVVFLVKGHTR